MPAAARTAPARHTRWRALTALTATGLVLGATGCGATGSTEDVGSTAGPGAASGGPVEVVAAENVWGDITRQIGGARVRVTSVLQDPSTDPHSYESDPRDAAAVGTAQLVVKNGLGYDDFADKLVGAATRRGREVLTVAEAVGARGGDANPHLWYSPTYVQAGARAIADRLTRLAPDGATGFSAGLQRFLTGYQPYVDTLATIRSRHAGARVGYTERVPGYLVEAAGLTLGTPASFARAVEDGSDPSPADTDAVDRAISAHAVQVLLYNAQVTSPVTARVQDLARSSGVPVVGVTETVPEGAADFSTWQTAQARAVLAALGG